MDSILAIFDGSANWSFWFVIALIVDLIILYISLVYTVSVLFWDMGWPTGNFNLGKYIIKKNYRDLETREKIKKLKAELKQKESCNSKKSAL